EGRFPFLDIGVLDSVARMPPDLKLRGFREKYVLRQIGARYLPSAIVEREKFPFAAPGSPQLLRLKTQWVEDLLSYETVARQGYFNRPKSKSFGSDTAIQNSCSTSPTRPT